MSTTLHNTTSKIDSHADKQISCDQQRKSDTPPLLIIWCFNDRCCIVGHVANRELQVVDKLSMLA